MEYISIYIYSNIVNSTPAHGEVYSIQHYMIKFVSDVQEVSGFSLGTPVSSINKTYCHDITEILLKVALSTKTPHLHLLDFLSTSFYFNMVVTRQNF